MELSARSWRLQSTRRCALQTLRSYPTRPARRLILFDNAASGPSAHPVLSDGGGRSRAPRRRAPARRVFGDHAPNLVKCEAERLRALDESQPFKHFFAV